MNSIALIALPILAPLVLPLQAQQDSTPGALRVMRERIVAVSALTSAEESSSRLGPGGLERLERELIRAETALAADDWLESLRPYAAVAEALVQTMVVFETEPVESLEALAVESRALRSQLEELGSPLARKAERPAALQALLEDAHSAAWAYLTSAGEQGREASLRAGIYYLKIARGQAEVARLLAGLECPAPDHPLGNMPGLTPYLDRIEAELLELYQPPLTQDRHATFIRLSAALKFAREMRDQDHLLGALEKGLEVARGMVVFHEDEGSPDREILRRELARWEKKLDGLDTDVSLPTIWLAEAHEALEDETSDVADVGALFERVLDDYFACFVADGPSSAPTEPEVTVTLVRWPFT